MKTLYIFRHAKSSWDDSDLADFDRPLNDRGRRAAPFMGRLMAARSFVPDVVVSSPAKRAQETAEMANDAGGLVPKIDFDERIYEASPQTLRAVAAEIDDQHRSAMLVGHNPGMEAFVRYLTGRLEPMTTAALAIVDLDIDSWSEITGDRGHLREIIRPKEVMPK